MLRLRHIELSVVGPKDTDIITDFVSSAYDHLIMKMREREAAVCVWGFVYGMLS